MFLVGRTVRNGTSLYKGSLSPSARCWQHKMGWGGRWDTFGEHLVGQCLTFEWSHPAGTVSCSPRSFSFVCAVRKVSSKMLVVNSFRFPAVMKFMGDLPLKGQTDLNVVCALLKVHQWLDCVTNLKAALS